MPRFYTLVAATLFSVAAHAALPPVTPGERVLFSEDFTDNRQQWSAIAVVNAAGKPASTQAAITKSEWTASLADSQSVTSSVTLKTVPSLKNGPVSIYISAKVADHEGTDGNRFGITLAEAAPLRGFVRLVVRPATNGFIEFRNQTGAGQSLQIESTRSLFNADTAPRSFKLTLTPTMDGRAPASAEAFYYDSKTKAYVSYGRVDQGVFLTAHELPILTLTSRNGENGSAWIDSVVVTQSTPAR